MDLEWGDSENNINGEEEHEENTEKKEVGVDETGVEKTGAENVSSSATGEKGINARRAKVGTLFCG